MLFVGLDSRPSGCLATGEAGPADEGVRHRQHSRDLRRIVRGASRQHEGVGPFPLALSRGKGVLRCSLTGVCFAGGSGGARGRAGVMRIGFEVMYALVGWNLFFWCVRRMGRGRGGEMLSVLVFCGDFLVVFCSPFHALKFKQPTPRARAILASELYSSLSWLVFFLFCSFYVSLYFLSWYRHVCEKR